MFPPRRLLFAFALAFLSAAAPPAQGAVVTLVSDDPQLTNLSEVATDGVNLYTPSSDGGVFSVPLGGGAAVRLYSGVVTPNGIAVLGSDLFVIDANSGPVTDTQIFRGSTDGTAPFVAIYTGLFVGQPIVDGSSITTDGTRLYTADQVQGRVHSLNPDGSGLTQLGPNRFGGFFDREHSSFIAEDGGTLFLASQGRIGFPDTPPRVQSIPATGGTFTDLWLGPVGVFRNFGGITVLDSTLYITEDDKILSMPITGGTPTEFVTDPRWNRLRGITALDGSLYVANNDPSGAAQLYHVDLTTTVPEPASLTLLASLAVVGGAGYGWRRWRRRACAG